MKLAFELKPMRDARADALLVPVDENGHIAGGAAASAIGASLPTDLTREERNEELEDRHDEIKRAAEGLGWGEARVITADPPFKWYVVVRGQAHATADGSVSPAQHAAIFRDAVATAAEAAAAHGARSLATTLMGTRHRVTAQQSAFALVSGARAAGAVDIELRVFSHTPEHIELAKAEWQKAHSVSGERD